MIVAVGRDFARSAGRCESQLCCLPLSPSRAVSSCSKPPVSIEQCIPHSFGAPVSHHQRPERGSSSSATCPGAGSAADRLEALVVQLVVGHVVGADIVPDLFVGPVGQRREFDDAAVVVIDFDLADIRARRPLVAPEPCHPGVVIHQRAAQRQNLAHLAAEQAQIDVAIEEILAVLRDHLLHDIGIGQKISVRIP